MSQDSTLPLTYRQQTHPLFPFDKNCTKCRLGAKIQERNARPENKDREKSCAVLGAGPDDLSQVKLILISDFPGAYESRVGTQYPMFDNRLTGDERKKGLIRPRNAGALIRFALKCMYNLNTYTDVWMTNAVKCDPGRETLLDSDLKKCVPKWLTNELQVLDEYCPDVPILVAGNKAFNAMKILYPTFKEKDLKSCRRRDDIRVGKRPVVFTENPSRAARSEPRIETEVKVIKGKPKVTFNEFLYPPLPGTPTFCFIEDLKFLAPFLLCSQ